MSPAVVVETDDTREDLIHALAELNASAKAERRRGAQGIYGQRYADYHRAMDTLIDGILFRDAWDAEMVERGVE